MFEMREHKTCNAFHGESEGEEKWRGEPHVKTTAANVPVA